MSVETEVRNALIGDAGVAALVGARVYPQQLPPDVALPAIAYRFIDGVDYAGLKETARVQLDIYGATYSGMKALRDAVRACADRQHNWVFYGGPDIWQDGQEVHHQSCDVRVFR